MIEIELHRHVVHIYKIILSKPLVIELNGRDVFSTSLIIELNGQDILQER